MLYSQRKSNVKGIITLCLIASALGAPSGVIESENLSHTSGSSLTPDGIGSLAPRAAPSPQLSGASRGAASSRPGTSSGGMAGSGIDLTKLINSGVDLLSKFIRGFIGSTGSCGGTSKGGSKSGGSKGGGRKGGGSVGGGSAGGGSAGGGSSGQIESADVDALPDIPIGPESLDLGPAGPESLSGSLTSPEGLGGLTTGPENFPSDLTGVDVLGGGLPADGFGDSLPA
ncbi:hypothetical protein ETB97_008477 [Aspergillus alliaceus]|uniref:Uncharacterized protein n=1 Tax=Petromyces alliaceus TaxID=209559 RepID=A0A8H5ZSX8_PETAA|nr:hypothetical protein ETB97_008477 [Aspergillus burnettii]